MLPPAGPKSPPPPASALHCGGDAGSASAHGVDSATWARDEAVLAGAGATAHERTLIVASEPSTSTGRLSWHTLPANAMLVYSRILAGPPTLTHIALPGEGAGEGGAGAGAGARAAAVATRLAV
jgi:hypothetical protein